jgi:hypothetical protein
MICLSSRTSAEILSSRGVIRPVWEMRDARSDVHWVDATWPLTGSSTNELIPGHTKRRMMANRVATIMFT